LVTIRKETYNVPFTYLKCINCNDEVLSPKHSQDPLVLAYDLYREKHGLLKPDEIKKCRETMGLTQAEFARLLGLGLATMSRYENGALQDMSHDSLIRLALEPNNMVELIHKSTNVFSDSRKIAMLKKLTELQDKTYSLERAIESILSREPPNVYNGYTKINFDKLINSILFLCKNGVWKTKLNKLLFYADFKHFKEYTLPITGIQYAHLPFGPCPNKYELLLALLYSNDFIYSEEVTFDNGDVGDLIKSKKGPDYNTFSSSELFILAFVEEKFKKYSAGDITKFSHQEDAYKRTNQADFIPFDFAKSLQI